MKYLIILLLVLNLHILGGERTITFSKNVYSILDSSSIVKNFNGLILIGNNDSILFCHSKGYADFEHNINLDEHSVFNIASLTKQFTAAAILFLEEKNLLSTKDTISKYIPEFLYSDEITIHQLLTHTSGIPCYNTFEDYNNYSKKKSSDMETLNWIEEHPLSFTPGTNFEYSNSGYFLLNAIIEEVSGSTYREFLSTNIFNRAGMMNTDNYSSKDIIPNHASRYLLKENVMSKADWFNNSFKKGSSSIFSTSADLFKWYKGLTSFQVLSDSSVSKMFTDHYDGYCYGVGKGDSDRTFFEHDGKIPGINAYSAFFFDPDYYMLVWSNTSEDTFWDLRDELRDLIINLVER